MFKNFWQEKQKVPEKNDKTTQQTMGSPKSPHYLYQSVAQSQQIGRKFSERTDEYRCKLGHQSGGLVCADPAQVDKLRSVGKQMIKLIGRKILSGSLNLTKISFPIRACAPKTSLQNSIDACVIFPYFMNAAAQEKDPMERFKLVSVAVLASSTYINMFLKPLNPIIGQTLQAELQDGTKIYCEQISHHPPISYFLVYGPNQCYQYSGYYDFEISPGLNSLNLKNVGDRRFLFNDGTEIVANYPSSEYTNTFIGTNRIQEKGDCIIRDLKNEFSLKVEFGKMKKKPTDHFETSIMVKGEKYTSYRGTYCGFIDIGHTRYWDVRDFKPYELIWCKNLLESDWSFRPDIQFIRDNEIEEGQKQKQLLEEFQRNDVKLRKKYSPK